MLIILALAQAVPQPPPPPPIITRSASPVRPPSTWISNDDYPAAARLAAQSGVVVFRLDIDATGKVTGCTIIQTSQSPSLDATTCQVMSSRARFHPALGANGQPIASHWASRVRWALPEDSEPTFASWSQLSTFEVGKDGRLDDCVTTSFELARFRATVRREKPGLVAVEFGANPETLPPLSDRIWTFPGRRLRSLDTVAFALTPDGHVGRCDTPAHSGDLPATLDLCGLLRKAYEQGAPHNAAGADPGVAWFAISTGSAKAIRDMRIVQPPVAAPSSPPLKPID